MDLGLSQEAVAQRLQVNAWTVLNWEWNKTQPGAKHLGRITEFLGYFPIMGAAATLPTQIFETRQRLGLTQAVSRLGHSDPPSVRSSGSTWARLEKSPRAPDRIGMRLLEGQTRVAGKSGPSSGKRIHLDHEPISQLAFRAPGGLR
ncbi:MAG: helix-turn-helix transcriptional regulator [Planctomycetes bacterium]|nr:helix-turn-helix transcriptional regulator [Planctomycetota bacterium]